MNISTKSIKINDNQLKSIEINEHLVKSMNQIIKTSKQKVGGRGEACKLLIWHFLIWLRHFLKTIAKKKTPQAKM